MRNPRVHFFIIHVPDRALVLSHVLMELQEQLEEQPLDPHDLHVLWQRQLEQLLLEELLPLLVQLLLPFGPPALARVHLYLPKDRWLKNRYPHCDVQPKERPSVAPTRQTAVAVISQTAIQFDGLMQSFSSCGCAHEVNAITDRIKDRIQI